MPSIFLSYAQPDSVLATRVFEDLRRARVGDVWCYETTSEYGADFRREYSQKIVKSDVFVLFDSRHARISPYVKDEVAICRGAGIELLICLSEPVGKWR